MQMPPEVERAWRDYEIAASSPETDATHYEHYRDALRAAIAAALESMGKPVRWCVTRADGTFNGTEESEDEAVRRVEQLNRSVDAFVQYRGPYRVTPLCAMPISHDPQR